MYLHLLPLSPLHSPARRSPSPPNAKAFSDLFTTFDVSFLCYLKSLLAPQSPSEAGAGPSVGVSLAYLSHAATVLSSVHSVAGSLISDPFLSGPDEAALVSYIDSSIKLMDVCNAVLAEVERLYLGRLLLVFIVHLLSAAGPLPPEKIQKARESIREWEGSYPNPRTIRAATAGLIPDMKPRGPPSIGKATALGRVIYNVEALSALVSGALVAFLGGELDAVDEAPSEFGWADGFNELRAKLYREIRRSSPGEMELVGDSVRKLAEIVDETVDDGEKTERLRSAVAELEGATRKLTEGLGRLRSAVAELEGATRKLTEGLGAAMGTRNTALQSFRPGAKKCK